MDKLICFTGNTVGHFTKNFIVRRKLRRNRVKIQRQKRGYRPKMTVCPPDDDYGATEDIITEEELRERKIKLDMILMKTLEEKNEIERETRGQNANPLWFQHRQFRITASNFGKICKMKQATNPSTFIKNLLSNKFTGNAATRYGQDHEMMAIQDFQAITGLSVNPCGLFVGTDNDFFLGASPDGVVAEENDAIIEVKCPAKLKNMSVLQGVVEKKINFLKIDENNEPTLKMNHNYYYQIQGQLHLSNKNVCYFVVWSPVGAIHIEKVYRDNNFWRTEMYPKLTQFYNNALLPEILKIAL